MSEAYTNSSMSNMEIYVAQASDVSGQLLTLVAIAAIMGLGKGGVPGFATIATAAAVATAPLNITGGLGYAVALQVPMLAIIDVYAAWLHSDNLHWPSIWTLLPLSFVGMALGQEIDKHMTDAAARILVGVILLSILTLRVYKSVAQSLCPDFMERWEGTRKRKGSYPDVEDGSHRQEHHDEASASPTSTSKLVWACVVGIIGGMATMLTNSMGPILNVYLLSVQDLSPSAYIGTRAMFFCFINMGKIPMRFMSGSLGWPMVPLAAGLGLVAAVGVYCAKPIMLSMSESTFVKFELAVVAFAGLRLLWMGLHT